MTAVAAADKRKWRKLTAPMADGGTIAVELPDGTPPAIAQLGMAVLGNGGTGIIIGMTPGHCIVEYKSGQEESLCWGEVTLQNVKPGLAANEAITAEHAAARQLLPLIERCGLSESESMDERSARYRRIVQDLTRCYTELHSISAEIEEDKFME